MLFFLDVMLVVDMLLLFLGVFLGKCAFQNARGLLRRWSHFGSDSPACVKTYKKFRKFVQVRAAF